MVQMLIVLIGLVCLAAFGLGVAGLFRRSTALLVGAGALGLAVIGFAAASFALA